MRYHTSRRPPRLACVPLVQMLYTIKGNQLRVAFVEENDGEGAVINDLYEGDVTFFPQGLIHYQQNLDCEPATFLAALNSEDAGVVTITTNFFELPSEAIQVSRQGPLHWVDPHVAECTSRAVVVDPALNIVLTGGLFSYGNVLVGLGAV